MAHTSLFGLALVVIAASAPACSDRQPSTERAQHHEAAPAPLIDATRAKALVAAGGILVDVREARELAETGKLRSALHLPLPSIRAQASNGQIPAELQPYKDQPVIFYCRSGRRSAQAAEMLRALGVTDVYNLGGFDDAAQAGFPTEDGSAGGSTPPTS